VIVMLRALLLAGLAAVAGCGDDESVTMIVEVKTDMVPGVEFAAVRAVVTQGRRMEETSSPAFLDDDFREARRIAEIGGLASGELSLRVDLLGARREAVLGRTVRVDASSGPLIVTVVITRSCRDVVCPNDGSPEATECLGGRCVPPDCSALDPTECGVSECNTASDCAGAVACVAQACEEGSCLELPGDCPAGLYCQPGVGCLATPEDGGLADAGPSDASRPDAATMDAAMSPDAGPPDAGSPPPPDTGPDAFVMRGPCDGVPAGMPCRIARHPVCDVEERCDGVSPDCPVDVVSAASTVCRAASGECDLEDRCSGGTCPETVRPATHVCRTSPPMSGECDPEERCDGVSPSCPPNVVAPDGRLCNFACGDETCEGGLCTGGVPSCGGGSVCICDYLCAPPTTPCPR
jgi:hypothetical protein